MESFTTIFINILLALLFVMAPILSSNWKQLQSTIKKAPLKKEKTDERARNSQAKRKRLEEKEKRSSTKGSSLKGVGTHKQRMNGSTSAGAPSASLALWAEDNGISAKDLAEAYGTEGVKSMNPTSESDRINEGLVKDVEIGQFLAIDCEMVGVGGEEDRSVLARVSLVNFHGTQVYDSFVKPKEFVTDWRTHVSGVSKKNMATARPFDEVQEQIAELLKDRILIGHAIKHDLDALMLGHPKSAIRDTSRFSGFRKYSAGRTPSLKKLAKEILGVDIQGGEHSSIEDARATMLLFRRYKPAFDTEHAARYSTSRVSTVTKPKRKGKAKK